MKSSKRYPNKKVDTSKGSDTWKGEIPNSFVQIVAVDKARMLKMFIDQIKKLIDTASQYFSRVDDIIFEGISCHLEGDERRDVEKLLQSNIVIHLRAYAYSDIGGGLLFRASFKDDSFDVAHEAKCSREL
ncbi:hypothetical protein SARC_08011 [Sphaeroforma arctica JP610]|uniref:Uncharacterized protein n=1 Tax=Sphaeroforma arctica JP610 TaxID=667725 RepID=A0A0L0FSP7_9EUKA|nr:hypothetical protein SARC_08011 [Sphaeroforma arctica JP610]KNC79601.1 hypothetical protein SARC_08011 [Sphaeroforma arctica JP610]|eukprot:XP_014153503.1 hypothetical protein SARC_08011 [Sphaeroforma arctica JP610]